MLLQGAPSRRPLVNRASLPGRATHARRCRICQLLSLWTYCLAFSGSSVSGDNARVLGPALSALHSAHWRPFCHFQATFQSAFPELHFSRKHVSSRFLVLLICGCCELSLGLFTGWFRPSILTPRRCHEGPGNTVNVLGPCCVCQLKKKRYTT